MKKYDFFFSSSKVMSLRRQAPVSLTDIVRIT